MILKINNEAATLLIANVAIGGGYFSWCENKYGVDKESRIGEEMIYLADFIACQYKKNSGKIELDDVTYVSAMLAVRAAFEACLDCNSDAYDEIISLAMGGLESDAPRDFGHKSLKHAHVLLDYLECHATDNAHKLWIDERRQTANTRLSILLEQMEE